MKTLIEAREEIGLSRQRFAELVGVAPQQLRLYEVGAKRPQARNADRIATALGVRLEDIREFEHIVQRERAEQEVSERMSKASEKIS